MARAGRKRKDVARKAGRIDWWAEREDPAVATKWHLARDRYLEMGANPAMASQAGKLYALRQLSELEVEAAERWRRFLLTNRRVVLGLASEMRGSALERVGASLAQERDPEWVRQFREKFEAAQAAILQAGKPALSALNRLCRDEAASSVLPEVHRALVPLIVHFHLQPRKGA
jgi:hypothetical protein